MKSPQQPRRGAEMLPPIPILERCPMELLLEYAETFLDRATQRRRWTIALEVYRPAHDDHGSGIRWFAVVSFRPQYQQLFKLLPHRLRLELRIPGQRKELEKGSLGAVFRHMAANNVAVWFFPLFHTGAVAFVRKPTDDPDIKRILEYNRAKQNPGFKLEKMTAVTRTAADPSEVSQSAVSMQFKITDGKAFRRSLGGKKPKK